MAEKHSKRQREETLLETEIEEADAKRHKSYNEILSFLEDEEPTQHLSSDILFTTLQQEISASNSNFNSNSSDPLITTSLNPDPESQLYNNNTLTTSSVHPNEEEEDDDEKERVIRHLLEASDDELGIPNRIQSGDDEIINGGDFSLSLGDGFWEFEDEAANYYTLLQSQLFL
ncbi:hypothetical protein LguiB_024901 [Lonicera macranthoides]